MSFNGDLEHFPLVDVIQMLHMTAKTGILRLKSPKGESQLVFHEGFLVSANHLNGSVRIGQVLVDMNAITQETLDLALVKQKEAGQDRKPLITTLIASGMVEKEAAYKGLETLIEKTIIEVLTWGSGTFSLEVSKEYVSDEYRYFPEKLHQEILLNAQGVLMDSLRIYDEKMRDGTLSRIFFTEENCSDISSPAVESETTEITADLLGLDNLDSLSQNISEVFTVLKDSNRVDEERRIIADALPGTPDDQRERLVSFLAELSREGSTELEPPARAVILLTQDGLFSHAITTLCKHENLFVFATDEEAGLDTVIEQSFARYLHPVLIIDISHDNDGLQALTLVRQKITAYSQISILITACCDNWRINALDALTAGAKAIIPRPCQSCQKDSYVFEIIKFLSGVGSALNSLLQLPVSKLHQSFILAFNQLESLSEPPEVVLVLLRFVALQFERAITFVLAKSELIAEKSIGVTAHKFKDPSPPLMFRIPFEEHSLLHEVVENCQIYYGEPSASLLTKKIYQEIGAPLTSKVILIPVVSRSRVIAIVYADFGDKPLSLPQIDFIQALVSYAGLVIDNALYRKSIDKLERGR